MKKVSFLALIGLIIFSAFVWTNKDEFKYRYDWYVSADKPSWWNDVDYPEIPEIENIYTVRKYQDRILTEPCCNSDKYKEERKILSKSMYFVVRDNYDRPYIAASALGHVSANSVTGWNRKEVLKFYLRHFYWVDYTSCASCMVGR